MCQYACVCVCVRECVQQSVREKQTQIMTVPLSQRAPPRRSRDREANPDHDSTPSLNERHQGAPETGA